MPEHTQKISWTSLFTKKRDSLKGKIVCKEKPRVLFVRVWQTIICWILISGRIFLARFSSVILCGVFWHTFRMLFYVSAESRLAAISSVIAQVSHSKLKCLSTKLSLFSLSYTLVLNHIGYKIVQQKYCLCLKLSNLTIDLSQNIWQQIQN